MTTTIRIDNNTDGNDRDADNDKDYVNDVN